jgi:nucleoside-diphosphate-sugar epimerase
MYEIDGAPELYRPGHGRMYDEHVDPRPDSLYGVSKVFGEAMGRYYVDRRGLRVICLRIGAVGEVDDPDAPLGVEAVPSATPTPELRRARHEAIWLSHRDCVSLFAAALEADNVDWAVVYGVSDNAARFWSLESAERLLGWRPQDGAR